MMLPTLSQIVWVLAACKCVHTPGCIPLQHVVHQHVFLMQNSWLIYSINYLANSLIPVHDCEGTLHTVHSLFSAQTMRIPVCTRALPSRYLECS